MQKKKNTYVLMIGVIVIWATVFYRAFSIAKNETSGEIAIESDVATRVSQEKSSEIDVNYRDPFLGLQHAERTVKNTSPHVKRATVSDIKGEEIPKVEYRGIVSDQKNRKPVYLVTIEGRNFLLKKGGAAEMVDLVDGCRQWIDIRYKKIKKRIPLNP